MLGVVVTRTKGKQEIVFNLVVTMVMNTYPTGDLSQPHERPQCRSRLMPILYS